VVGTQNGSVSTRRKKRHDPAGIARQQDVSGDIEEAVVLTW
jgi:hypothetical protein